MLPPSCASRNVLFRSLFCCSSRLCPKCHLGWLYFNTNGKQRAKDGPSRIAHSIPLDNNVPFSLSSHDCLMYLSATLPAAPAAPSKMWIARRLTPSGTSTRRPSSSSASVAASLRCAVSRKSAEKRRGYRSRRRGRCRRPCQSFGRGREDQPPTLT